MSERTLAIIKPDAVAKGAAGQIFARIEKAGFTVIAARMIRMTEEDAAGFYAVHRARPFFKSLCTFMTQGPCIPMVLEADNAIQRWRDLMGATDPAKAAAGHDPQGLRGVDRGQRRPRLRRSADGGVRDSVLLQQPRSLPALAAGIPTSATTALERFCRRWRRVIRASLIRVRPQLFPIGRRVSESPLCYENLVAVTRPSA